MTSQISSLSYDDSTLAGRKITQIIAALEEVRDGNWNDRNGMGNEDFTVTREGMCLDSILCATGARVPSVGDQHASETVSGGHEAILDSNAENYQH